MLIERPNPDELLSSILIEEKKGSYGKLRIFFGMCAGVGKTYTMLQVAHSELLKGVDIVIGIVETHNRIDTTQLAAGFESLPRKKYAYKSTIVEEMDLDAIIARKPEIVLVDELAHTNAPGSRHTKRYQDVLELLDNGINVYTTLNVQHLESRSETVAQITGIVIRETLPDEIFEKAEEIELIDLTPDELLERFSEGKIYSPERSLQAVENFFRKGNITALREMALRIVADRVDKQLHDYLQHKKIRGPWKTGLHLLVAIDYKTQSTRLLRWAKNLSYSMGANIQAVYIETLHKLTQKEKEQLDKNIKLAKQLGINFRIITHVNIVKAIVDFAQKENITHIIVGKPRVRSIVSMFLLGNFINRLIRYSGDIDVYILGADSRSVDHFRKQVSIPSFTSNLNQYLLITLLVMITSFCCYQLNTLVGYQVISFGLLFVVSILALFFGTGPILLAASLSALIWDFFFIPPKFTFYIDKPVDALMFMMFFIIALLNGILTSRVRRQEKKIRVREERTHALYQLIRDLASANGINEVLKISNQYISKYFLAEAAFFLKNDVHTLEIQSYDANNDKFTSNEWGIASWVFRYASKAGKFTDTLPATEFTFFPLIGSNITLGVVAIKLHTGFTQGEEQFWNAVISHISGKIEREQLRYAAKTAYVLSESDKLYKTLINSISHELRIPVSTIMGASETLLTAQYPEEMREKLHQEIYQASNRLNRLIENLLNMSRLESGRISPSPVWCDVHDLANAIRDSLGKELESFVFTIVIPEEMPLVNLDIGLTEQAIYNLVLNATQYAPSGTTIRIKFFYDIHHLFIQVMDRGPGFPLNELPSLFNKFYRGTAAGTGGTGLGLSIVKGFVEAQNGTVSADNRKNGGAIFTVKIPVKQMPQK